MLAANSCLYVNIRGIILMMIRCGCCVVDDEIDMASVAKADDIDPEREEYYRDDPRKALKKYFDREGMYVVLIE